MSENDFVLSEEVLNKIRYFIQDNDPLRVSRNLRTVLLDYIRLQYTGLPNDFEEMLDDVENLIELMEMIADETKGWRDKMA